VGPLRPAWVSGGDVAITVGSGTSIGGGDFSVSAGLSTEAAGGQASIVAGMSETTSGVNLALAAGQGYTRFTIDGGVGETALGGLIVISSGCGRRSKSV
jgi:hypothetical protein